MSTAKVPAKRVKYGYFPSSRTLVLMCKHDTARRADEKLDYPRGLTCYEARTEKRLWRKGVRTMHCPICGQWHLRYRDRIGKPRGIFVDTSIVLWKTLARWKNNLKFAVQ
jgi:hypothetical protein